MFVVFEQAVRIDFMLSKVSFGQGLNEMSMLIDPVKVMSVKDLQVENILEKFVPFDTSSAGIEVKCEHPENILEKFVPFDVFNSGTEVKYEHP